MNNEVVSTIKDVMAKVLIMFIVATVVAMVVMLVVTLDPLGAGIPAIDRGLVMFGGLIIFCISLISMLLYDIVRIW